MKVSRMVSLVALIFFIALGTGTGIYISRTNDSEKKNNIQGITLETKDVETSAKNNNELSPKLNSIGPKTKIIKKQIYTKGEPFEKILDHKLSEDILGMDKKAFEEYAKKIGYSVEEFTGEKVVIIEEINEWPKGLYVLKAINENIAIFKVDETGNLNEIRTTEVILEQASENEKEELIKGKVYNSIEDAEHTLADYDS